MSADVTVERERPTSPPEVSPSASPDPTSDENIGEPDDTSTQAAPQNQYSVNSPDLDKHILSRTNYIDLSNLAAWTVSSAKPNYGIANIHDTSLDTYWQSDGPQPHSINIHFRRLMRLQWLSIFMSFSGDESYTPSEILIRSGTGRHELLDVCTLKFLEPQGWQHLDLTRFLAPSETARLFETRLIQVQVLANHQNGKDSHIRSIRMFKPRDGVPLSMEEEPDALEEMDFDALELSSFTGIR